MKILFFSQARNLTGCSEIDWETEQALPADALWDQLLTHFPDLKKIRSQTRLSRNGELATPKTQFHNTDEVALIPPVSGG